MQNTPERRCLRSEDPQTAITYQLAYAAVQAGMEGLVLSDNQGMLIGAAPSTHRADEIAALSPLAVDPESTAGGDLGARPDVTIHCFDWSGTKLLLIGLGGMASRRAGALVRSMHGVVRILGSTAAPGPSPMAC